MEETREESQQSIGTYFLTRAYAALEEAQCERSLKTKESKMKKPKDKFTNLLESSNARQTAIRKLSNLSFIFNILVAVSIALLLIGRFFGSDGALSTSEVMNYALFLGLAVTAIGIDSSLKRLQIVDHFEKRLETVREQSTGE